jgi:hypothetical protein
VSDISDVKAATKENTRAIQMLENSSVVKDEISQLRERISTLEPSVENV